MRPAGAVRIKSYFAASVDQAMAQARMELGADALLLNTRKTAESDGSSRYEVTMGVTGSEPIAAHTSPLQTVSARPNSVRTSAPRIHLNQTGLSQTNTAPTNIAPTNLAAPARAPQVAASSPNDVMAGLAAIREQISSIQALLTQQSRGQLLKSRLVPELAQLHEGLLEAQVDPALSLDIMGKLEGIIATDSFFREAAIGHGGGRNRWKSFVPDPHRVETVLRQEMERRVRFGANIGVPGGSGGPVTVMVGPTGGGKTTSLAKLAAKWATPKSNLPVRVISLDSDRPGALQQLQALARGPSIRHSVVKAFEFLPAIIADQRNKECLLIDTPGFMAANESSAELLAKVLRDCPQLDVHLVVPAYMSAVDFKNTIERYRGFNPAKLLVTKLDEAQTFGTAFSMAVQSGLALSFLADGPHVPQDLHAATAEAVLGTMGEWPRAQAHHAA